MTIHGTLLVCLDDYRNEDRKRIKHLAKFCGVQELSVAHWGKSYEPRGETLIKLWQFLAANNRFVDEYEALLPTIKYLGKLFAFGVVTHAETMKILSLSGGSQHLWPVLRGMRIPNEVKTHHVTVETLQTEHGELLEMAENDARERGIIPFATVAPAATTEPKPVSRHVITEVTKRGSLESLDAVTAIAASGFRGLAPLLQVIASEGPDAIEAFRTAVGSADDFHNILDLLKSFSSRKAQELFKNR